jgi:hypothetical protein
MLPHAAFSPLNIVSVALLYLGPWDFAALGDSSRQFKSCVRTAPPLDNSTINPCT